MEPRFNPYVTLREKGIVPGEGRKRPEFDFAWYVKELFYSYKFGEKSKFSAALDKLAPYLDQTLLDVLQELERYALFIKR